MLGTLISEWTSGIPKSQTESLLLSSAQLNREIGRERIRATRRSIPFCIVNVELLEKKQRRRKEGIVVRLLQRNLRVTDQIGSLGRGKFGILLVDTPEPGGRAVIERLSCLFADRNLQIKMVLKVHKPDGYSDNDDDDGDIDLPHGPKRRRKDDSRRWLRVDEGNVEVTGEDPLVPRPVFSTALKRAIDIAGASVGLILTAPIVLPAMAAVRLTSRGPALFTQTREGKGGRPFKIYKLRSMVVDAEAKQDALRESSHRDGPAFKIKKDPRVTKVGSLLRATCVDELPQLWNVLVGDMSLVGPRPLPWHESRACNGWHRRRLDVRPGLTCFWQVNKTKAETFDDWMRMDLRYLDEMSLTKDLCLIAQTITVPILGRGSE